MKVGGKVDRLKPLRLFCCNRRIIAKRDRQYGRGWNTSDGMDLLCGQKLRMEAVRNRIKFISIVEDTIK